MFLKKWVILRRLSQVSFFALFIILPQAIFALDPLAVFSASLSERTLIPDFFICVSVIILTLLAGRFFCGWICPLGSTFDLAGSVFKPRFHAGRPGNAALRSIKYVLLAVIAVFAAAGVQVAWVLDPIGIISRPFIRTAVLAFSFPAALMFLLVCATVLIDRRFWCRNLCPLGAAFAAVAKVSLIGRKVDTCKGCMACLSHCRMGAIRKDLGYSKGECIMCMDCLYDCPSLGTRFGWGCGAGKKTDISRRNFLLLAASSLFLSGFGGFRRHWGRRPVIRPPAAIPEEDFVDRCIRCGNCLKVCVTGGLQPDTGISGLSGLWTPRLVPEIGHCDYNCALCGDSCPTGAIRKVSLEEKREARLGVAVVDMDSCLAWSEGRECMVCERHCPVPGKAIKAKVDIADGRSVRKPLVDGNLCIGCGLCQNKCPVHPARAIRVVPF